MVEKYWGLYWWFYAWLYILWNPLVHPLIDSQILSWSSQPYSSIIVCLWFPSYHLCTLWLLQPWVHLLIIIDNGQYYIFWTLPWGSFFYVFLEPSTCCLYNNVDIFISFNISSYVYFSSITSSIPYVIFKYISSTITAYKCWLRVYSLRFPLINQPHE